MKPRTWLKRSIGVLMLTHVFPVTCLLIESHRHESTYLTAYAAGWCVNAFSIVLVAIALFIVWCFED